MRRHWFYNQKRTVKEACDNLPTGLCFAKESGLVLLVNRVMEQLSHSLTGSSLQDAAVFWAQISDGTLINGARRVYEEEQGRSGQRVIRLSSGEYRTFTRTVLTIESRTVVQLTAADTTGLYDMVHQLERDNEALQQMHLRLQRYQENISMLTREEELLNTKIRIHDDFGKALMRTRHALAQKEPGVYAREVLEVWRSTTAMMRLESRAQEYRDPLEYLKETAAAVGVELFFHGTLPGEDRPRQLIAMAASEALTNAVRHAGATRMEIEVRRRRTGREAKQAYIVCFYNNGQPPAGDIVPGGGISSLRKKLEQLGGEVHVESRPVFCLRVTIPAERQG